MYERLAREHFAARRPFFALLGSGDYHHFSLALIANRAPPLTVVLFDNHPDWMQPPHRYHCGTWVFSLARLPQIARVVIIGLESNDLLGNRFARGDVASYVDGKIVLLPTSHITVNIPERGRTQLGVDVHRDPAQSITEILAAIATKNVYISVDKDCLRTEDAYTNWEQGTLPLSFVLDAIRAMGAQHTVVGADTVGDYSPPIFQSPLKWIGSITDRPQRAFRFGADASNLQRNQTANLKLLSVLDECR